MLPPKRGLGEIGLTGSRHSENATAYSLGRNRESVNDGLGIEFDFCSLGLQFCRGAAGSPTA